MGLRHDDGDAERGLGVELGGGIEWTLPGIGLTLDLTGRALLAHAAEGLEDHGFSAALVYDPRPETERGVSLSLRQDVGGSSVGGVEALFAAESQGRYAMGDAAAGGRLALEAAWGLPVFGGGFTGSPHVGYGLSDAGRDYSLGWRLAPAGSAGAGTLSLEREGDAARAPERRVAGGSCGRHRDYRGVVRRGGIVGCRRVSVGAGLAPARYAVPPATSDTAVQRGQGAPLQAAGCGAPSHQDILPLPCPGGPFLVVKISE